MTPRAETDHTETAMRRTGGRTLGTVCLPGDAKSVPIARHWARTLLTGTGHRCLDDTLLLLSEIVTNAVLHTRSGRPGGRLTVRIAETDTGLVRLAVTDEGAPTIPRRRTPDADRTDGRGIYLLEQLAHRWGFRRTGTYGCLWADIGA